MTTVAFNFWFNPLCVVHVFADEDDDAGERKDDDASEDAAEREIENILLFVDFGIYVYACVQKETSVLLSLSLRVCVCVRDLAFERTRAYDVRLFG